MVNQISLNIKGSIVYKGISVRWAKFHVDLNTVWRRKEWRKYAWKQFVYVPKMKEKEGKKLKYENKQKKEAPHAI